MASKKFGGFLFKRLYLTFAVANQLWGFRRPDGKINDVIIGISLEGREGYKSKVLVIMFFIFCLNIGWVKC